MAQPYDAEGHREAERAILEYRLNRIIQNLSDDAVRVLVEALDERLRPHPPALHLAR